MCPKHGAVRVLLNIPKLTRTRAKQKGEQVSRLRRVRETEHRSGT